MPFTVALIHARLQTADLINREFSLHLPHVYKFNILDETIFYEAARNGLTPRIFSRLIQHFAWAEQMKAHVILNTTAILEPAIPTCQKFVSIPILRFNEPMCECALAEGQRICVLGSVDQAIEAVADLLREIAQRQGRPVQVLAKHVPEADEQLGLGDWEMHNRLVVRSVRELTGQCDVIVLAQISLLPLVPALKCETDIPIYGSAEPMIARLAKLAGNRTPTPVPTIPGESGGAPPTAG